MASVPSRLEAARLRDFPVGTRVRVRLGAGVHEAVVIEHHHGLARVHITIAGGTEPVQSSYRPSELERVS
ncbi:MAG: hypothetical protein ACT4QG_04445 [Sporichthyaceae bacterium]